MAEMLGLGMSHFGGFMFPDEDMASRVRARLENGSLPPLLDHPSKWPPAMRSQWGSDGGAGFARRHRNQYFAALDRIRGALDDFAPDAIVIFGDDQYECFKEDLVPPYCVFLAEEFRTMPYLRARAMGGGGQNIWNDPRDAVLTYRGAPAIAGTMIGGLMEAGFDPAYSCRLPHQEYLGHAFTNTLLYLDHRRAGMDIPIIPFAVNAYGADLIKSRGGLAAKGGMEESNGHLPAPPAPSPARCFDMGRAIARTLTASPWRVALVATGDLSHSFLTAKNHFFYPDTGSDRARFAELGSGDYAAWRALNLATLDEAGQHELLNWCPMVGAMHELGQKPSYCELIEGELMATNKCAAIVPPAAG